MMEEEKKVVSNPIGSSHKPMGFMHVFIPFGVIFCVNTFLYLVTLQNLSSLYKVFQDSIPLDEVPCSLFDPTFLNLIIFSFNYLFILIVSLIFKNVLREKRWLVLTFLLVLGLLLVFLGGCLVIMEIRFQISSLWLPYCVQSDLTGIILNMVFLGSEMILLGLLQRKK